MSHYCVAVIHTPEQDVNELLAPYSENIEVAPHIVYSRDEAINVAKKYECNAGVTDENKLWQFIADMYAGKTERQDGSIVTLPRTDWDGNIYSTYNEAARWDWYSIEGPSSHFIKLKYKNGYRNDIVKFGSVKIRHIDFSDNDKEYKKALKFWADYVEGGNPDASDWYKPEYYKEIYLDAKTYATCMSRFSTYSVVTPGGIWFEAGRCGWFGTSLATPEKQRDWELHYKERFIDTADPDWLMTFVDCHI
jgi:hypothetical protein